MATRQRKIRVPAPPAAEGRADHCPAVGDRQVVLALQGGGALGAYQAGVYEALHEACIEPDWVIGTSIGAINAALIVGNAPENRVECLHAFWDTVAHKGLPALWPGPPGLPTLWTMMSAVGQGLPGFFAPNHPAWMSAHLPLAEDATGYYHTAALRNTFDSLVDTDRLNANAPRLTVGAVNVRSGEMRYLQLWRPAGDAPRNMWQVAGRQKDIQFASRVNSHVQRQAQIHQLRHIVRELARELPPAALARPELREMASYGCGTVMHVMRLVAPRMPGEDHTRDMDFSTSSIRTRWQAGLEGARRAIAQQAWLSPAGPVDGLNVHDVDMRGAGHALS